ncbi:MAG: hypothetical protein ACRCXY_02265 [Fusobacteriaceae bacterium]
MKTIKEAISLLPLKEQKEILDCILKKIQDIPHKKKESLDKERIIEFNNDIMNKFLSSKINDENFEKLKKIYLKN